MGHSYHDPFRQCNIGPARTHPASASSQTHLASWVRASVSSITLLAYPPPLFGQWTGEEGCQCSDPTAPYVTLCTRS